MIFSGEKYGRVEMKEMTAARKRILRAFLTGRGVGTIGRVEEEEAARWVR